MLERVAHGILAIGHLGRRGKRVGKRMLRGSGQAYIPLCHELHESICAGRLERFVPAKRSFAHAPLFAVGVQKTDLHSASAPCLFAAMRAFSCSVPKP